MLHLILELFAFIFAIFVMLPISYICEFLMSHIILTYILMTTLFIWAFCFGIYECKKGDIYMKDNEIPIEEVNFKISKFIF
jgi:hypothetical protein